MVHPGQEFCTYPIVNGDHIEKCRRFGHTSQKPWSWVGRVLGKCYEITKLYAVL